jgi:methionine synthase II (cobalamin-independent)
VAKQLEQARDDLKHSKSENEKLRQVYAREIAQTKQQRAELVQQVDELNARWRNVHHFASPEDDALEQWANKVERANQIYERTLVSALKAKISDQAVVDDIVNAFQTLLLQHVEAMSATSAAAAAAATGPDAN